MSHLFTACLDARKEGAFNSSLPDAFPMPAICPDPVHHYKMKGYES